MFRLTSVALLRPALHPCSIITEILVVFIGSYGFCKCANYILVSITTDSFRYRNQMSEGGARSSSVGGLKSAKKDSRPVIEKSFQIASQQKVSRGDVSLLLS